MGLEKYLEYGVATLAVVGLIYIATLHVGVIKNHIKHSTEASQRLANMIGQMLRFLERSNGGKK